MTIQRVTPKPSWKYSTAHWPEALIEDVMFYAERERDNLTGYFSLNIPALRHLAKEHEWAKRVLTEIPEDAMEEIMNGDAHLWIDVEWPNEG